MSASHAERLRGLSRLVSASFLDDAADEIDRLTAENARLREALWEIAVHHDGDETGAYAGAIARAALPKEPA